MIDLLFFSPQIPWCCFAAALVLILIRRLLSWASFVPNVLSMIFTILGTLLGLLQGWTLEELLTPLLAVTAACLFSLPREEGGNGT